MSILTIAILVVVVPILMVIAFVTVAERKIMGSMQRRCGPNAVGLYGLFQPFADALKLLFKEIIIPRQSNNKLFIIGPFITLIFSLLGWSVIPYAEGITIFDFELGILVAIAIASLGSYGILISGWAANSKYAFIGSIRSTAQLLSYELVLSSIIFLIILFAGSFSFTLLIESQKSVWYILPLLPIALMFFVAILAETNRAPFDLAEAESELVSGFMTEHAAVIFVFFFLAEYASIVLICVLTSILFLGGYLYIYIPYLFELVQYFDFDYYMNNKYNESVLSSPLIEGLVYGLALGLKSCIMIFVFIWARASFPRIRFDQLMSFCWTILLPIVIAFIILVPCILYSFDILPSNIHLL